MTATLTLAGCRTGPLGSYLKALGVLRLVAEQCDQDATGRWRGDYFELTSRLSREELTAFFLRRYQPSPVVAPWNSGAGFRLDVADGNPEQDLAHIEAATDARLASLQETVRAARATFADGLTIGGVSVDRAKGKKGTLKVDKGWMVRALRASLPDDALEWLDASIALTSDEPCYPPLLGSGGNVGRLDLSNNYYQRLMQVFRIPRRGKAPTEERVAGWLSMALHDDGFAELTVNSNGQFDPAATGGVNGGRASAGRELDNPWDFILAVEGALIFASATSRRLGATQGGRAAAPFTVHASAAGHGTASDAEGSAGEFWAPVWTTQTSLPELGRLMGEGRASWRGQQARTGLDLARAVTTLGTDRGIDRFVRWGLPKRKGTDPMAIRMGTIKVSRHPGVEVLGDLDEWADRVRRLKDRPADLTAAVSRLDRSLYRASNSGSPRDFQDCLIALAQAELRVSLSRTLRDKVPPMQRLARDRWLAQIDDSSAEARLAVALTSAFDADGECLLRLCRPIALPGRFSASKATNDASVAAPPQFDRDAPLRWTNAGVPVSGLGVAPLSELLPSVMRQRAIDPPAMRRSTTVSDDAARRSKPGFHFTPEVHESDVARLLQNDLDWRRFGDLVLAALLVAPGQRRPDASSTPARDPLAREPAWDLLAPFFSRVTPLIRGRHVPLDPRPHWPLLLAADDVVTASAEAIRELRMARLHPLLANASAIASTAPPGPLLAAGLLFEPGFASIHRSLARVADPDQGEDQ